MTSRLHTAIASPDWDKYDTLVAEAIHAFEEDVMYVVQIVESARSISDKKSNTIRKHKAKF